MPGPNPNTPRQNRVDPWGNLISNPARGAFMGNRGLLHDGDGRIRRTHRLERWIICLLEFKGWHRQIMRPGHYTELFFWDEATALAAGHRPCAECRRQRYNEFREVWMRGNPDLIENGERMLAPRLDRVLHRERMDGEGGKATLDAILGELPDGVFVVAAGGHRAYLVWEGRLWPWRPGGYDPGKPVDVGIEVEVLTPRSTVNALAQGFRPSVRLPPHAN